MEFKGIKFRLGVKNILRYVITYSKTGCSYDIPYNWFVTTREIERAGGLSAALRNQAERLEATNTGILDDIIWVLKAAADSVPLPK